MRWLWLLSLQNLAPGVDPTDGSNGTEVDFLDSEAPCTGVQNDASQGRQPRWTTTPNPEHMFLPLQLSLGLLARTGGGLQGAGIEVDGEDGLRFGVALTQDAESGFVVFAGGGRDVVLRDAQLDCTVVVHDLRYSHSTCIIDLSSVSRDVDLAVVEKPTTICHCCRSINIAYW